MASKLSAGKGGTCSARDEGCLSRHFYARGVTTEHAATRPQAADLKSFKVEIIETIEVATMENTGGTAADPLPRRQLANCNHLLSLGF
ncbi:hypothetical protein [Bradyrhizobium sp. ARR65]|uniref:hypothetical protein n=1 Tax=Bradyrhizobium sp. ARR65 TaxID=1040989 RepID=UPI000463D814|nr:hypothetical protein [Bradyrhizobium sp. ARR65]